MLVYNFNTGKYFLYVSSLLTLRLRIAFAFNSTFSGCFILLLQKIISMDALLILHNLIRWLVLIFGFLTFFRALTGVAGKRAFTSANDKSNLFFMIFMDVQLLIGLILYFTHGWFNSLKHFSESMKTPMVRFFTIEHSVLMIIAWILVHAGRIVVKKAGTPQAKFKKSLIYFGIALLIILIAIPWPFRETVARPWFRWF